MKSYILAVAITMFLSALYAFQNVGDVSVRFLVFHWVLPQGVWEILLFASGAVLMWVFSLFASVEGRSKYKKQLKEKDEKIAAIEKEKATLFESLSAVKKNAPEETTAKTAVTEQTPESMAADTTTETAE
ncbi:LapA family protein [Synergistaceae bacterium OttesenSCG-928-D05]|nr:LapA family protein [Synergistaceae bacterium OttesenSCG-928-D05]